MLPSYAYTDIEAVDLNKAKKRVQKSLKKHYELADSEIYFTENPNIDLTNFFKFINDLKINLNNFKNYIDRDANGNLRFVSQQSYIDTTKLINKLLNEIITYKPVISDIKINISNISIKDFDKLIREVSQLKKISDDINNYMLDVINIRANFNFDRRKVNELYMELTLQYEFIIDDLENIIQSYNEKRKQLYSKKESIEERKMVGGYSLNNLSDYKIGEYV
jgi:hypothetical protein